jgi:hypothetical protein
MTSEKKPLITQGPKGLEVSKTKLGNNTMVGDPAKFR